MPNSRPLSERFNEKYEPVTESGCWLWTAFTNACGYGCFRVAEASLLAHRVSYELHVGPIPDGLHVLHKCDTPPCVNPAHLFLGTHTENMADMVAKGRCHPGMVRGEGHGRSKLTEAGVRKIRAALRAGIRPSAIAREYPVGSAMIRRIKHGLAWTHI